MTDALSVVREATQDTQTPSDRSRTFQETCCATAQKPKGQCGTFRFWPAGGNFQISMSPRDPSMTKSWFRLRMLTRAILKHAWVATPSVSRFRLADLSRSRPADQCGSPRVGIRAIEYDPCVG